MTDREIYEALFAKVEKNMQDYQNKLFQMSPGLIVGKADEIVATNICYNELVTGDFDTKHMDFDSATSIARQYCNDIAPFIFYSCDILPICSCSCGLYGFRDPTI